jgi:hypothetical protein
MSLAKRNYADWATTHMSISCEHQDQYELMSGIIMHVMGAFRGMQSLIISDNYNGKEPYNPLYYRQLDTGVKPNNLRLLILNVENDVNKEFYREALSRSFPSLKEIVIHKGFEGICSIFRGAVNLKRLVYRDIHKYTEEELNTILTMEKMEVLHLYSIMKRVSYVNGLDKFLNEGIKIFKNLRSLSVNMQGVNK